MNINFERNHESSNFFNDRGTLIIGKELKLDNAVYRTSFIWLWKLLGRVEDYSIGQEIIHLDKASLIQLFRKE